MKEMTPLLSVRWASHVRNGRSSSLSKSEYSELTISDTMRLYSSLSSP